MRNIIRMLLIVTVSVQLHAQWTNISGPGKASITGMTKKGDALIVGTDLQGIHVTTNRGESWRSINGNLSNYSVQSILATSTHIFAGVSVGSDKGLYRTTNDGVSWTKYTSPFSNSTVNCLAKVDTVILAGAVGMFRSLDGGLTFQSSSSGIPAGNKITSITNNGSTVFAAGDGGIYRSTNLGGTWTEVRKNTLYTELSYSITSSN
ncbi:MAG: hypothetical protein KA247_07375 [Bacteroidetes bacterium]|nr:hypothetical protein [Bacteroidota bacterium]